jgi:hypothetical protein
MIFKINYKWMNKLCIKLFPYMIFLWAKILQINPILNSKILLKDYNKYKNLKKNNQNKFN